MAQYRRPNQRLRELLGEATWTGQELADAVNRIGGEDGLVLRYDRTSVSHWLIGTRPRGPVPELVAEALSRRLGRSLTRDQVGFPQAVAAWTAPADPGSSLAGGRSRSRDEEDAVAILARLGSTQTDPSGQRRRLLAVLGYSVAALTVPGFEQADLPLIQAVGQPGPLSGRVELFEVEAAERLASVFHAGDTAFGGGHARQALASYLAVDLAPKLRRPASPAVRGRLLAVCGQLAYQCAFMCFDDEKHGHAQQYYRAALRLAAEGGDPIAYAVSLRGMSVQAHSLGHPREAVRLAEAAAQSAPAHAMQQAFLQGQLAVTRAADHEPRTSLSALAAAERRLEQTTSSAAPLAGAYHQAALLHQQSTVRRLLGDRPGAIAALQESVRHRPAEERRSRAIVLAELAELQLGHGHLEQAVATWHRFLDDYPVLASGRATSALTQLLTRLRPYAGNPGARALLHRATAAVPGS